MQVKPSKEQVDRAVFLYKNGARNLLDAVDQVAGRSIHFRALLHAVAAALDEQNGTSYMLKSATRMSGIV